MPTKPSNPLDFSELFSAKPGEYVKFSDKLTDSLQDITRMIDNHKEMIDAIQELGIQLTDALGALHTLTVKYAGVVNSVLDILLPLIKKIPFIPPRLLELATSMERVTQQIMDNSAKTSKTILEANEGLRHGDVNRLRGHSGELQEVTKRLTAILPENE